MIERVLEGTMLLICFPSAMEKKGYFESANTLKRTCFSEFNLTEINGITSQKKYQKLLMQVSKKTSN
jgi:hypothetical protein